MSELDDVSPERIVAEIERRITGRRLWRIYKQPYDHAKPFGPDNIGPYDWQIDFHKAGAEHHERCIIAANRVGKTECVAAEVAIHLTGEYPPWWTGRRFDKPISAWAAGESTEAVRDIIQLALLGELDERGEYGSGWIPRSRIHKVTTRQAGVQGVADTITVKHTSGGLSKLNLKTYEQERKKWQGTRKDIVWFDEEPPMDIYTEGLTRTLDANGLTVLSFTPLLGPSDVVLHFMEGRYYVKNVGWNDAPHLDEDAKARLLESFPIHERETRSTGTPLMGSGAIFPIDDARIMCDPFKLPDWWLRINGCDFGIDHPAAGAFCALDSETGTFYVYDCYKASGETAIYHAAALKKHGEWIPCAWPHDGLERDKGSGTPLKDQYRSHGLSMLREHAHYRDERGSHVEPGLIEMYELMRTGKFKVFSTCSQWFEEKRLYRRENGQVVKKRDDILSATRYAFVMRRFAHTRPVADATNRRAVIPMVGGRR